MKCPECQSENREGARFCNECGNKFDVVCPKCGNSNRPNSKFCDECGHDLSKSTETPPVDYDQPQSYTPKFLAEKILTNRSSIEGERKLVTVLFADVSGFTTIAEKLDPEEVHEMMNRFIQMMMDEVHRYEGNVNQILGDGVMALFGAPIAHEDHAQRAVMAGIGIQNALAALNKELKENKDLELEMRIGINSGLVVVGSIGDDLRMDYTAKGDTVNLASRVEQNADPGQILVTEETYTLTRERFELLPLGAIEVKGRTKPVEIYEVAGYSQVQDRLDFAPGRRLTKLIGRKSELEYLMDCFHKAEQGRGQVVSIVGEAGIGKSRLILEFKNAISDEDYTLFEGQCFSYGKSIPYGPFIDIVKDYCEIVDGDDEATIREKVGNR